MYDEGIRQQIETMPNNFRVVSRWRIMRIVDQFEPAHAAITDDGSGTEAGVNERVACEGIPDNQIKTTLRHRTTQNERIAAVDPDGIETADQVTEVARALEI